MLITPFKLLMEETALTASAAAEHFDVSVKTIESWMQGARNAPDYALLELQKIAQAQSDVASLMARGESIPNGKERGVLRKFLLYVNPDYLIKVGDLTTTGA